MPCHVSLQSQNHYHQPKYPLWTSLPFDTQSLLSHLTIADSSREWDTLDLRACIRLKQLDMTLCNFIPHNRTLAQLAAALPSSLTTLSLNMYSLAVRKDLDDDFVALHKQCPRLQSLSLDYTSFRSWSSHPLVDVLPGLQSLTLKNVYGGNWQERYPFAASMQHLYIINGGRCSLTWIVHEWQHTALQRLEIDEPYVSLDLLEGCRVKHWETSFPSLEMCRISLGLANDKREFQWTPVQKLPAFISTDPT
jgi:hypothetical protein